MLHLGARNVNDAIADALDVMYVSGIAEDSRNGAVYVMPTPVTTTFNRPTERVLFSPMRDANPFFHLMESLWMLAGRDDVAWPSYFSSNIKNYSDNGTNFWGAYGFRWKRWFNYDQLQTIITELRKDRHSRRAVLSMWDGHADLQRVIDGGKDVPCNTHVYFDLRGGALNMTVCNRSNDIMWGTYGANAVQYSILLEYLAAWLSVPVGLYRQMSNNFHIYSSIFPREDWIALAKDARAAGNVYGSLGVYPLIRHSPPQWDAELAWFFENPKAIRHYTEPFFPRVAQPMYRAWEERKEKKGDGLTHAAKIEALDWRLACTQWIIRKERKKQNG